MVFCRNCGKVIKEQDNYCLHCGAAVRAASMPPPVFPYPTPKDHSAVVIAIVVIVAVIGLPMLMSGLMYVIVTGGGGSQESPTTYLEVDLPIADIIGLSVHTPSDEVPLDDVWVSVQTPQDQFGMNAGSGHGDPNMTMGGSGQVLVIYHDLDGDRVLSSDDRIEVKSTSGPLYTGLYQVRLDHQPTGGTIASVPVTVP
jgi:hypothetical protein